MGHRHAGRGFVLGVSLLALLGAGCTPDTTTPPPATSTSATPTESAQEREERVAYEAAEKSYREFRAEFYRVLRDGGAKSATSRMKATAAGPYLKEATEVVQAYNGLDSRSTGSLRIVSVKRMGYSKDELSLETCEDSTGLRSYDTKGKLVGRGEIRLITVEVRPVSGAWKVWSGSGKKVAECGG